MGFRTRQIHAGVTPDPQTGSTLTPIYQTTTYGQAAVEEYLTCGGKPRALNGGDQVDPVCQKKGNQPTGNQFVCCLDLVSHFR